MAGRDLLGDLDLYLLGEGRHHRLWEALGAHAYDGGTRFAVWAPHAREVRLVGDFNGWSETATEMKKLKDGRFSVQLELEAGKDFQFRYLVNGKDWHNDWEADKYVPNPFSGDNSVVTT